MAEKIDIFRIVQQMRAEIENNNAEMRAKLLKQIEEIHADIVKSEAELRKRIKDLNA